MSSSIYNKQNSSPIQTRRAPIRNDDIENNYQRQKNSRSLSSKFRNLFQKNSSSPDRSTNNDRRPPLATSNQRSPSPQSPRVSTEAPHIRAPILNWTFGKKKTNSTATKTKSKRKIKQTSTPFVEISNPAYQREHETSIRGQNFVPRTPELLHGGVGRTQSSSSYEATTKGFRDYMIIDHTRSSEQVVAPRVNAIKPTLYTSDHSRSPSLNHQRLRDTSIEYSYHRDTSPPISDNEINRTPKQQRTVGDTSSLTATQILARKTPLLSPTVTQTTNNSTNSDQWKKTSYSSLNNAEIRSITSSSKNVEIPKLNAPLIPLSSTSSKKKSKQTNSQFRYDGTYNSLSTVNNLIQPNQSYTKTYGSLPNTDTIHNDSFIPTKTNFNNYPELNKTVERHPPTVHFNQHSPITTPSLKRTQPSLPTTPSLDQTQRFDVSTTTLDDYDRQQQWFTTINNSSVPSPSSIHRRDDFIRPLTPKKSSTQPDVSVFHVNVDDLRGQSPSRTSYYNSTDSPMIYRSSTVIYTKDKHKYIDGGELRTWSVQGNNDIDTSIKPSTSIQISPSNEQEEYTCNIEQEPQHQYSNNRYSDNINNSHYTRSSIINERDKIVDQMTRSYTQEARNTITPVENSEVALRHYTLERTDSYDGLGILLSADAHTRLNHRIRDIESGSPGFRAGLRKNDRIIKINGINVENIEFSDVLILIEQGLNNNNNLQLSVIDNDSIV